MNKLFKTLLMAVFLANLLALPVFSADFSGSTYSETDASNTAASPNGWASGTYFNQVEPIGRATLGGLKRWFNRVNCTVASGGSSNAYTYTPVNTSYPIAYNTGDDYCFIANFANTGAATINIDSLGTKNIYKIGASGPTALTGGEIQIGQPVLETYDGTEFVMLSPTANIVNLSGYALLNSPTFTGTPAAPTASAGTNTTQIATTAFVTNAPSINQPNLVGSVTNDNAASGSVGEYISSTVTSSSPVSLTNSTPANVTSVSLTAGDWDVCGNVGYSAAGSTVPVSYFAAINTTSATLPSNSGSGAYSLMSGQTFSAGALNILTAGCTRESLSTTTSVYLVAESQFTTSTMSAYGFIGARRRR